MAGPALGAFIVAIFRPLPFLAIAFTLLFAALLTAFLKGDFKPAEQKDACVPGRVDEGLPICSWGHPMLLPVLVFNHLAFGTFLR